MIPITEETYSRIPKILAGISATVLFGAFLDGFVSNRNGAAMSDQTIDRLLNLTKTRSAGSRDSLNRKSLNNTVVQLDSEKIEDTSLSTSSRSTPTLSEGKSRTSKNSESSMIPSIPNGTLPIRKYPEYYYTLSDKGKWKYRKSLS